jgi:thiol-disulfide isomerase/thioredoxin
MLVKTWVLAILMVHFVVFIHAQKIQSIKMTELAAYANKTDSVLVINFWATFCKPCVEEIPFLQKICKKYTANKVKLILVSLDGPAEYPNKIRAFIHKKKFSATHFWLNETDADYFCPQIDKQWSGAIPATLIVNKANNYRGFFEQSFKETEFEAVLKNALGL